jgi:surfactin synthase thioesterase subunit
MTNKLVNEINFHMKSLTRPVSRISFIGHSLGCILIR